MIGHENLLPVARQAPCPSSPIGRGHRPLREEIAFAIIGMSPSPRWTVPRGTATTRAGELPDSPPSAGRCLRQPLRSFATASRRCPVRYFQHRKRTAGWFPRHRGLPHKTGQKLRPRPGEAQARQRGLELPAADKIRILIDQVKLQEPAEIEISRRSRVRLGRLGCGRSR